MRLPAWRKRHRVLPGARFVSGWRCWSCSSGSSPARSSVSAINTGTTIVTFLMVFLIQATQNRDTEAMHLKLDELIRATRGAHNRLMDLEEREEDELDELREQYENIAKHSRGRGSDEPPPRA
jgi:hypothetical protein